jgi:hypothetical protein
MPSWLWSHAPRLFASNFGVAADKGYTDSQVLVDNQRIYGVTLIGPVADDPSWQARAGTGFDKAQFRVDWDQQVVTCPMGKQSISWLPNTYPKNGMTWEARFARAYSTDVCHPIHGKVATQST